MMARASPWWVFAFAVCGARARRRGRGEEPRSMYFALHDLYNQTIDVWLLAGYPHSGAGWVRNLWDVSLGIASESVHQVEGDTWNRRSGSWGTRCGSRPPPDARSAAAKRCEKIRRARRDDPILVATGYPHDATGGDRRGDVDGAVVVTRDARGWCERHAADRPEGRRDLLCGFQSFNPTSMCAYSNDLDQTLWQYFENLTRAIDSPKNQPNRL